MRLRIVLALVALAVASLACNLTGSASPPNNSVGAPVIGLQPLTGAPGTVITVAVTGFTPGALVNLLALPEGQLSPTVLARDLTIGTAGSLNFALSLPPQIGTTPLTRTTALTLTVATADQRELASAVFVAVISNTGTAGSTLAATPTQGSAGGNTGGSVQNLYITAPAINSLQTATQITVFGSGASFDNQVNVQLQDINNNVIANGVATIQSTAGVIGAWQVTISFTQPAQRASGYIYAFTLNRSGGLAQAASIPIIYAGAGAAVTPSPGGITPGGITPAAQVTQLPIEILITNTPRP